MIQSAGNRWLIEKGVLVKGEVVATIPAVGPNKLVYAADNLSYRIRFVLPNEIALAAVVGDKAEKDALVIRPAATQPAATQPFASLKGCQLLFTSGKLQGLSREIVQYDPGSGRVTLSSADPLPMEPVVGDDIRIAPRALTVTGYLRDQRKGLAYRAMPESSVLEIAVDPNNLSRWTDRLNPSLAGDFLAAIILGPLLVAAVLMTIIMRGRVLRLWRNGHAMQAVVVETRHAAAAPLSRVVRFTLAESRDRRVLSALVPSRVGELQSGDTFWVVCSGPQAKWALVAGLYV